MRSVLVVHASAAWASRVAERLGADGWATEVIEGGERALDRFVQEPSDAVVVDLDLRGRDGAATIESLRWAPGGRTLPIVLTGIAASPTELAALAHELGVQCVPSGDPDDVAKCLEQAVPRPPNASVQLGSFDDDLYATEPPHVPTLPPPSMNPSNSTMDPEGGREGVDVDRRARALAKVAEVRGRLEQLEVAEVLTRLADLRATGALVVELDGHVRTTTGETPKKIVFFRNGVPIHVRSNLEDECLGQLLVRRGMIDRATMDESLARVRDGDGRQGGILVAMGVLEPRDLRDALEHQQETKLFSLFAWRRGSFHFSEAMTPPAETITLELSLAEIVARAFRTQLPADAIEAASAPFLDRYVWASELGFRGLAQVLEDDERALLEAIDGHATLRTLLERQPVTAAARSTAQTARAAALRAFHAARCLGCVTFREVAFERGRASDRSAAASKRLRELLSALRAERYAEVFELTSETDLSTLRRRGAALRAEARKLREDVPIALHPLSDELHHRLGRAEAVLVSDRERTDSDTTLPSSSPSAGVSTSPSSPPVPSGPPSFSALRAHDAVTRELPAAMQIPARAEVSANDPPTRELDAPAIVERTEEHPSVAPIDPSRDPAPHDPATSEHAALPPADVVAEPEPEVVPPAEALDARVERMLQAERAMRRARRAVDRDQLVSAREAVAKAVQLVPDEPEFAAELAWIDAKAPDEDTRREALTRLDDAARLAPKNARIHVLRAEVLVAIGAEADARAAYERALAANPDDPKALAGLRTLIR